MITLDDVSRRYESLQAVAPLSLAIHQSESVALLGPSGSGKTTLLALMAGAEVPSSGRVFVDGRDLAGIAPGRDLARIVGMVHQQFDLVPHLSALHNTLAGRLGEWSLLRSLLSLVFPQERSRAMDALDRVGLADRAPVRCGRLSGGEQQRVAIARLLLQDPGVVLADEPVSSLDPARAEEVLRLLKAVTVEAGKTLVASVHSVDLARAHFARLIGIRDGVVQFDLPSDEVTEMMLHELYALEGLRGAGVGQ